MTKYQKELSSYLVWPCGTYVLKEEYKEEDYNHMSDDYEIIQAYDEDDLEKYL